MKGQSTRGIHGRRDKSFRSVVHPIYPSSTFAVDKSDDYAPYVRGENPEDFFIYSRYHNPTLRNAAEKLAALEGAEMGVLFASGMAAITAAILAVVQAGDKVAASGRLYGMTYRFLRDVAPRFGIETVFLREDDLYRVHETVPDARLVYFETPINPTSDCVDIACVVESAQKINAATIVDNTFASPINQNPLALGVDVVVHSATKYIAGHSDLMAGAALGSGDAIGRVFDNLKVFGGCLNAHDAYLLDRSLKTLKVRMDAHNNNALQLAQWFEAESNVPRVYYPGLPSSASHTIAKKQMRGFGGMLCIELADLEAAKTFCDSLQLALNATSLGGVDTLVSIPVLTSHVGLSADELKAAKVAEGMVRISVGLEDVDDLMADFQQALGQI